MAELRDRIARAEKRIEADPRLQGLDGRYEWRIVHEQLPSRHSITPYSRIPAPVRTALAEIRDRYSADTYHAFNKQLLVKTMSRTADSDELRTLPGRISAEWERWCQRLLSDLEVKSADSFSFENDFFLKDLAVCRLKMVPAVCHLLERLGLEKKLIFRGDLKQAVRVGFMALAGRHKPYFQTHVDLRYLSDFNPSGRRQCFLAASELISRTPRIKGLFSSSWYNDPALEGISPHLAYLRRYPLDHGARLFRVGSSEEDVADATLKSKSRRRLYESGRYRPTCYLWVWPRSSLSRWAKTQVPDRAGTGRS